MKRLLAFFIVLAIAILIGVEIKTNPGYVLISVHNTTIETHLWVALIGLCILFFLLSSLVRLIKFIVSLPWRWHNWRKKGKTAAAIRATEQGIIDLLEGDYHHAQKKLLKEIKYAPIPLVNYFAAAIAAQQDNTWSKRDDYLRQAAEHSPHADLAARLLQAQLQYDAGQYDLALTILRGIIAAEPKQKQALRCLAKVYQQMGLKDELLALLPQVEKYAQLDKAALAALVASTKR